MSQARRKRLWQHTLTVVLGTLLTAAPVATQPPGQSRVAPAAASLSFEIASVRPADPAVPARVNGWSPQAGRLRQVNQTLRHLISIAYSPGGRIFPGLPDDRMTGGPDWIGSERFTVDARMPPSALGKESSRNMTQMLRKLLAERFALVARVETRSMPIYALVLDRRDGKLGPNLRALDRECETTGPCGIGGGGGRLNIAGASMSLVASLLEEYVGRPVQDRTGVEGALEGELEWTPAPDNLHNFGSSPVPDGTFTPAGPSIYTALREQLGLRLVPEQGPVEFLVIERAERPTPN